MKFLFAVLALPLCAEVAAQQMYKCRSASGQITYSSTECRELGLSSGGEIKGRANVAETPAPSVANPAGISPPEARRARGREEAPSAQSGAPAEEAPAKRCFTVKTAKGTSTRCNDTPE